MSEGKQSLQHQADRTKAGSGHSVLSYLVILFAVAFVLLLLAYFMQERSNQEALDGLQQTSNSAVISLQNLIDDRDRLQAEVADLEDRIAAQQAETDRLQRELDAVRQNADRAAEEQRQAAAEQAEQIEALNRLNELRTLYNARRYQEARELLAQWETAAPGALEQQLEAISTALSQEERDIYDPLEAYHKLLSWLE